MRYLRTVLMMMLLGMVPGCASPPERIDAAYVSPLLYQNYDCDQITGELIRISRRVERLQGKLRKTANFDKAQTLGGVLFFPVWFWLEGGDGPEAHEYARLKGEFNALRRVSIQQKCTGFPWPAK